MKNISVSEGTLKEEPLWLIMETPSAYRIKISDRAMHKNSNFVYFSEATSSGHN